MPVTGLVCLRSGVGIALSTVGRSPHFCTGVRRQTKPEPPCRQRELHKQLKPEWRTISTCFLVMWFDDSAWQSQSIRQSLHRCCLRAPYRLISLRFKPEFSHDCWWTNLVSPMSWTSWLEKELPNSYPFGLRYWCKCLTASSVAQVESVQRCATVSNRYDHPESATNGGLSRRVGR